MVGLFPERYPLPCPEELQNFSPRPASPDSMPQKRRRDRQPSFPARYPLPCSCVVGSPALLRLFFLFLPPPARAPESERVDASREASISKSVGEDADDTTTHPPRRGRASREPRDESRRRRDIAAWGSASSPSFLPSPPSALGLEVNTSTAGPHAPSTPRQSSISMIRVMPIIRSRSGCFTCRRRKKKCNEERPLCSGCRRNKLDCRWPAESSATSSAPFKQSRDRASSTSPSLGDASPGDASPPEPACPRLDKSSSIVVAVSGLADQRPRHGLPTPKPQALEPAAEPTSRPDSLRPRPDPSLAGFYHALAADVGSEPGADAVVDVSDGRLGSPTALPLLIHGSAAPAPGATPTRADDQCPPEMDGETADQLSAGQVRALCQQVGRSLRSSLAVDTPMALLPSHGHSSYELLSHYLSRTANSMGNGSTDVNPFVVKLVPLAFSNPLVLQLILAQSAAHRQASSGLQVAGDVAQQYYTESLRMFRNVVGEYVSGKGESPLTLTVGSLILCLTEVARGDVHGTIFDHLGASRLLLTTLLDRPESLVLLGDLADFLVEYYMHTAAASVISTDPHGSCQPLLSSSIERTARALVARRYMGQLCGCWLELLLLIPQVFQLGKTMLPPIDAKPRPPSADDIITFGFLQSQILAFFPPPSASPYSQLAGLVFKQAALLYLWSILGPPPQPRSGGAHADLVRGAVAEAVSLLGQFPASARVNTSLCWPLAVIGCCTADPAVRGVLRSRLQTMIDSIGLGNIRETLVLLERVWHQPAKATSPWLLHQAMQEHRIWISFA